MSFQKAITIALFASGIAALTSGLSDFAWADCDKDYQTSRNLLQMVKTKSLNNEKVDVDGTMGQFQLVVNRMQSGNCTAQLLQLFQFIQTEQQNYPAPGGAPQAPQAPVAPQG